MTMTRSAELCSFAQVGQVVFLMSSVKDSLQELINFLIFTFNGRREMEAGGRRLLNNYQIVTFDILQGKQESNPH